jgi:hypothetical protein
MPCRHCEPLSLRGSATAAKRGFAVTAAAVADGHNVPLPRAPDTNKVTSLIQTH